jgi:hypothetical protein
MASTPMDSDTLNYRGELFAIGAQQAPFLAAIARNAKRVSAQKFPIAVPWALGAAAQTVQSEDAAMAEAEPTTTTLAQDSNVIQIQKYDVEATLLKQSLNGQFSEINADGFGAALSNLEFQKMVGLKQLAVNFDYSCLQGTFVDVGTSATAVATRGLKSAITTNTVAAGGKKLEKSMLAELVREMIASGAIWQDVAFVCNAFQYQMLDDIYGFAPMDRMTGGTAISRFFVPGGPATGIPALFDPQMPTDEAYLVDLALCAPVFLPVPASMDEVNESAMYAADGIDVAYYTKGTVAAKKGGFLYMQAGFSYGAEEMHGAITDLATSA